MDSKRGTEKPIEIFIALFVILAVSLLVLQLFDQQISRTTGQLGEFQNEQEIQELRDSFSVGCSQACTEASNNGCTVESLAELCIKNSQQIVGQSIDLNQDREVGYNTESYQGTGVCEDNIPCFVEQTNTCCNRRINAQTCEQILCDLWEEQGKLGTVDQDILFQSVGWTKDEYSCTIPNADFEQLAWFENIDFDCSTTA